MKVTRKQLSRLIRESAREHNTKSVDRLLRLVLEAILREETQFGTSDTTDPSTMAGHVADAYWDHGPHDSYSGSASSGITLGWKDPNLGVSESDDDLEEDEEILDEDEDDVDEGEY